MDPDLSPAEAEQFSTFAEFILVERPPDGGERGTSGKLLVLLRWPGNGDAQMVFGRVPGSPHGWYFQEDQNDARVAYPTLTGAILAAAAAVIPYLSSVEHGLRSIDMPDDE